LCGVSLAVKARNAFCMCEYLRFKMNEFCSTCSLNSQNSKSTYVKKTSFKMPVKSLSFAVKLNVIKHIEGEHQLSVCKELGIAGSTENLV
jgi:hypothetical protein